MNPSQTTPKPTPRACEPAPKPLRSSPILAVRRTGSRLRAAWHLLIFFVSLATLSEISTLVLRSAARNSPSESKLTAQGLGWWLIHTKALAFLVVLIATWIVAKLERRSVGDFGLPWQRAFRHRFWLGAAIGFAALTFLLTMMHVIGIFSFGVVGWHGAQPWKYAFLSAIVFIFGALFEEWLFRGYVQFTLTSAIGFWPAAVVTSALFGYAHYNNSGETLVGTFSAGAVGLLFCLLLRRMGDLWMPIGFHAAWNWGETCLYGVANSGAPSSVHLFHGSFSGPAWLTGGNAGPEGSWLCLILIATSCIACANWLRAANDPDLSAPDTTDIHR